MQRINKASLPSIQSVPHNPPVKRPVRVAMIGEGVFLRTFVAWMIDKLNEQKRFDGSIAVLKPIPGEHNLPDFTAQDCLYTVLLRGIADGKPAEDLRIVTAIDSVTRTYGEWDKALGLFRLPTLRFVFSNTTEAGIAWADDDKNAAPPNTYPAKLALLLKARFDAFAGDPAKGLHILPCELIEYNATTLKKYVLTHLSAWGEAACAAWVESACTFTNTLVDRIVTGYPKSEIASLEERLGYEDRLFTTGEPFAFLALEGDGSIESELPLVAAGLPVVWARDITPYKMRKVLILNGAHTLLAAIAPACGVNTVRDAVNDADIGAFLAQALQEEILPGIPLPEEEKAAFASAVSERFKNPHMEHMLSSIALNAVSKFSVRVTPSIRSYAKLRGKPPARLALGMAAQLLASRASAEEAEAKPLIALWDKHGNDLPALVKEALAGGIPSWGDVSGVPGLTDAVTAALSAITAKGMRAAVKELI